MSDENNDQVVIPNDGSPAGHIEKMLGRKSEGDQNDNNEGGDQVAQRPENVPEKFWDAEKGVVNTEALLKAQADAEAALRQSQSGDGEGDEGEGDDDNAKQVDVVANASKEFAEKGELTDATFKSLEGVGITRDMVNDYIAGQQSIVSNLQSAAYGPFEGQKGYEEAANWAAANLSDDEIKAIDIQLTSNNPAIVKQGAIALQKAFNTNADVEPTTIRGNANSSTTGTTYKSRGEMMRDMSSSRYRTDEGFRREVAEKLRRSKL